MFYVGKKVLPTLQYILSLGISVLVKPKTGDEAIHLLTHLKNIKSLLWVISDRNERTIISDKLSCLRLEALKFLQDVHQVEFERLSSRDEKSSKERKALLKKRREIKAELDRTNVSKPS